MSLIHMFRGQKMHLLSPKCTLLIYCFVHCVNNVISYSVISYFIFLCHTYSVNYSNISQYVFVRRAYLLTASPGKFLDPILPYVSFSAFMYCELMHFHIWWVIQLFIGYGKIRELGILNSNYYYAVIIIIENKLSVHN